MNLTSVEDSGIDDIFFKTKYSKLTPMRTIKNDAPLINAKNIKRTIIIK